MLWNCLFVGCGGFAGSVLRYLCSLIKTDDVSLPVITLGVNVIGSFAIMFFSGLLSQSLPVDDRFILFLRVGLCGGFTTFSTFSAETLGLLEKGNVIMALAYAMLSICLCVGAAFLGEITSKAIV